ncbi:MAG: ABC transporter substrate-binding protein [Kiloniellales bacterium]
MTAIGGAPKPALLFADRLAGLLLAALLLGGLAGPASAAVEVIGASDAPPPASLQEPLALQAEVEAGALPPIAERLPQQPLVVPETERRSLGHPGGELRTLIGRAKDTRLLVVYGYARLVCYDENLELVADIAERVEVEDDRIFTITLRKGHKWSDGQPFTTEDMRYWWEDVANNRELSPSGPPALMLVDDQPPEVEVLDEVTIRYSWPKPNPYFLPALAGARPEFIYQPAHYMKDFHVKYADPAALEAKVKAANMRNWAALHNRVDSQYSFDNPDLPTLQPWMNTVKPPSERFVAKRNPYYHRVDAAGQQLPYIDRVILQVASSQLIPAKTGAGESDLQAVALNFSDFPFLKSEEKRSKFNVYLWRTVRGSQYALYPNLNASDPVWRELLRDVRFRRALSLAVNRDEVNQLIYFGLGLPGNQSVLPDSPLYKPDYREAHASFDLKAANKLLDETGLTERNSAGIRLLPDGRPLEIVVETAGENTQETDILQLIADSWRQVGVKLFSKPSQREVLRNRIFAGDTIMTLWFGYENAVPSADMSPWEFAPTAQHSYQWPKWGQYRETKGAAGEPIDLPEAKELMELYEKWALATSKGERGTIWNRMLEINAEQVYTIGIVAQIPQPIVVSQRLRNVPEEAMYNWDPGAQFGIYRPDSFWLSSTATN